MNPIYTILHTLVRVTLPLYYRKIYVSGLENIPINKPILIASNHQNAFLDGVLVAYKMKKQVYFLARSDAFKGKFAAKVLKAMNLVPIYRQQDGTGVENNGKVFQWCYEALAQNKCVLIFPEGTCEPHKHMFPLKKGMSRIALGALESYPDMDIQILPVGVNYSEHFGFRSFTWVDYGKPISVQAVAKEFQSSGEQIKILTSRVEEELKNIVLHLPKEDYALEDERMTTNMKVLRPTSGRQLVEIERSKVKNEKPPKRISNDLLRYFLSFPFLIIHQPLYYLVDQLAAKMTGKDEFYPSVKYGLCTLLFAVYWAICSYIFTLIFDIPRYAMFLIWFAFPTSLWIGFKIRRV